MQNFLCRVFWGFLPCFLRELLLRQDSQTLIGSRAVGGHISEGRTDRSICNSVVVALRTGLCCLAHVEGPVPSPLILPPQARLFFLHLLGSVCWLSPSHLGHLWYFIPAAKLP